MPIRISTKKKYFRLLKKTPTLFPIWIKNIDGNCRKFHLFLTIAYRVNLNNHLKLVVSTVYHRVFRFGKSEFGARDRLSRRDCIVLRYSIKLTLKIFDCLRKWLILSKNWQKCGFSLSKRKIWLQRNCFSPLYAKIWRCLLENEI